MKLTKCKLRELLDVCRGTSLAGTYFATSGNLMRLTLGNFDYVNNCFKDDTGKDNLFYRGPVKPQFILSEGEIITPLTEQTPGLLGSTARIPKSSKYIQSQDVGLIKPNEEKLDKNFCYYLVSSQGVREQLGAGAQQTKIRHTSPDKIKECAVYLPDLDIQKKFGNLLSSIDRKIALNRKKIKVLESMAKEMYDYWFVQYDFPDENGRPYKSSGGKMVYSPELKREIPDGWKEGTLQDVMKLSRSIINPKRLNGVVAHYSIPAYDANQFPLLEVATTIESSKFRIDERSILLSKLNPKFKRIWDPPFLCAENLCSSEFIVCQSHCPAQKGYLYFLLNDASIQKYMVDGASSSTGSRSRFAPDALLEFPLSLVPENLVERFSSIANNTLYEIRLCRQQIEKLTHLRDFLLPLLMNGQVNIR